MLVDTSSWRKKHKPASARLTDCLKWGFSHRLPSGGAICRLLLTCHVWAECWFSGVTKNNFLKTQNAVECIVAITTVQRACAALSMQFCKIPAEQAHCYLILNTQNQFNRFYSLELSYEYAKRL